ncbi:MAG: methylenetetrahydrofolate reductase [NAD(P)H] [Deltaproteobacteria bacterium]|nr:methylenetetrahydrofolate reductase [NAD(P)H] [Deltaproteobacteria bacterium]
MKISDRLRVNRPLFSFEFFPPKTEDGARKLLEVLEDLRPLEPDFVSVTWGAGGSTQTRTIEITERIKRELGIEAMAHFTCVGAHREQIRATLDEIARAGIENVLLLRGDAPSGRPFEPASDGFAHASELIEFVRSLGHGFAIGGACYPEGHPEAPSLDADLTNLVTKVSKGVDFLITQLFFDNRFYFRFVDRARDVGVRVPIIPGLMPITNVEQIERFTKRCGATIPPQLVDELSKRRADPERVHEIGVIHATIQSLGLLQGGAPGIHFFTLNRSAATRDILTAMRMNARL